MLRQAPKTVQLRVAEGPRNDLGAVGEPCGPTYWMLRRATSEIEFAQPE